MSESSVWLFVVYACLAEEIWSSTSKEIKNYPAESMNNFLNNHGLLNLYDRPQWYSVLGGSSTYVEKLLD